MKILHKYVLKEHLGPLVFSLTTLTSLLLLNYIAKQFGNLVGKGIPGTVILEFFGLSLPFTLALTFPMAVLVATLYAFGRLASENEITALRASGVSLASVVAPILWAAVGVTAFMVIFNDQIMPRSNHALAVLQNDIFRKKPTFALREQIINEVQPSKFYLRASRIDEATGVMRQVTIYDLSDAAKRRTIYADSGTLAMAKSRQQPTQMDLVLTLFHGTMQDVPTATPEQLERLYFATNHVIVKAIGNDFSESTGQQSKGEREMTVCEMSDIVRESWARYDTAKSSFEQTMMNARAARIKLAPEVRNMELLKPPRFMLGALYCRFTQKIGVPAAGAQSAPHDMAAARADTTHKDSARAIAAARDSIARRDSVRRDSVKRDSIRRDLMRRDSVAAAATKATPRDSMGTRQRPVPVIPAPRPLPTPTTAKPTTIIKPNAPPISPTVPRPPIPPGQVVPHRPSPESQMADMKAMTPGILEMNRSTMSDALVTVAKYDIEIHKKFALAVACFVFVLLGAPIALRFPRGGIGLTIGVSLFVFSLYYVGLIGGAALAERRIIPAWISMWLANVIFSIVALLLLRSVGKSGSTARGGDAGEMIELLKQKTQRLLRRKDA